MGRTVRELLRERMGGKSQAAFAEELGLTQSHLSKLLRGEYAVGRKSAARLIEKFPDMREVLCSELLEVA